MSTNQDLSGVPKHQWLTRNVIYNYTMIDLLRNDNELTGINLQAKFLEQCTNLIYVTRLTNGNLKLENHCTYPLVYKLVCNSVNMYVLPVLIIISLHTCKTYQLLYCTLFFVKVLKGN